MKVAYYLVYKRGFDGSPEKNAAADQPRHDTPEAAREWLVQALDKGLADGEYDDYQLVPFDAAGNMMDIYNAEQIAAAREDAVWLINNDPEIRHAFCGMLAGRQLYSMASTAAMERINERQVGGDDQHELHPMTFNLLGRAASDAVARGFDVITLVQGLSETVLPWMQGKVSADVLKDRQQQVEARIKRENERKATPIPTGVDTPAEARRLSRARPVVVFGYGMIISWFLRKIATTATQPEHAMCGFYLTTANDSPPVTAAGLTCVLAGQWHGMARNTATVEKFFAGWAERHRNPIDFILMDDFREAFAQVLMGTTVGFTLSDGLKRVRRLANDMGSGLVLGLPTPAMDPYTADSRELSAKLADYADCLFLKANIAGDHFDVVIDYKNQLNTMSVPIKEVQTSINLE